MRLQWGARGSNSCRCRAAILAISAAGVLRRLPDSASVHKCNMQNSKAEVVWAERFRGGLAYGVIWAPPVGAAWLVAPTFVPV